jgi:hypothetical protein
MAVQAIHLAARSALATACSLLALCTPSHFSIDICSPFVYYALWFSPGAAPSNHRRQPTENTAVSDRESQTGGGRETQKGQQPGAVL